MSASVKRKNPNSTRDLIEYSKILGKKAVYVGYPASVGGEMVLRASVHQFGSLKQGIPPRPFLDKGVENGTDKYQKLAKSRMTPILQGKVSVTEYYGLLGQLATSEVKSYIRRGDFTPLAPATIKRKGSSKPLIDTGQMRNTVTYEVRND